MKAQYQRMMTEKELATNFADNMGQNSAHFHRNTIKIRKQHQQIIL